MSVRSKFYITKKANSQIFTWIVLKAFREFYLSDVSEVQELWFQINSIFE